MTENFDNTYMFNKGQEFLQISKKQVNNPVEKQAKEWYFTKKDIQVAINHMKKCSHKLATRDRKLKSHWGTTTHHQRLNGLTSRQTIPSSYESHFKLLTVIEPWDLYSCQCLHLTIPISLSSQYSERLRVQLLMRGGGSKEEEVKCSQSYGVTQSYF